MQQKLFSAFALALGLSCSAYAQFAVGVSAGANMTFWEWHYQMRWTSTWATSRRLAGARRVAADWSLSPVIGLRAELSYQTWRNKLRVTVSEITDPANGRIDLKGYHQ
jgi:hypothetical protein